MAWSAGAILTAADLNTYIPQAATTFSPSWTNLSVGNGTVVTRTAQIGPMRFDWIRLLWGSTTSISGNVSVSISGTNLTEGPFWSQINMEDNSATTHYPGVVLYSSATTVALRAFNASATFDTLGAVTSTVPFTWTTSDVLKIAVAYFIA